ncbi:RlmE family RNA methyltransferase [Candidatus Pelagibacter sp. HIMB1517]|uniref:RlmE family RNA methyltransferase n=1 Tax=Candidatus Pelagibacter sp. HIMB1517 TaxID=3413341 RepID=UPI003F84E70B
MVKFKKKSLSGSSKRWIQRHYNDSLVLKAKKEGFRSRAVFKLEEINKKINFLKTNQSIIDLGSAPGSWSQYLSKKGFKNILAVDVIKMEDLKEVSFIHGDFTDNNVQQKILERYKIINVVLSDIAVNTTGNKKLDSFKTNSICLDVLDFAYKNLCKEGYLLCKFFNGELDKEIIKYSKVNFSVNKIIKPKSSRKDSKEMYLFCKK